MNSHRWRRFVPRRQAQKLKMPSSVQDLNEQIEQLKRSLPEMDKANKKVALQKLLILQTPRAALAQNQMDRHKHGYHNREKRLYELIDFNDSFVAAVLALDPQELTGFASQIKQRMADFCQEMNTPMFSDEQFDAIVRGLSVEIAVYRAASEQGLDVEMTSRTQDAFGIDMVVRDPATQQRINMDCKTPSAFRYRLEDLVKQKHITDQDVLQADEQDFITTLNRRDDEQIPVTTVCIRPERVGEIHDFSFDNPQPLAEFLLEVIAHDGYAY